jgi:DNA-binding HxlR family transcriptional regulator
MARVKSYNQYCPIARTSEFFAERWTPIIIRNLLAGCATFTEIKAGAPGIPKALLSDRLAALERLGVLRRTRSPSGRAAGWELTEMGRGLKAVCDAMGEWGARWLEMEPRHRDPAYAVWATCRLVDLDKVPDPGVVVRLEIRHGTRSERFWMMLIRPRAEVCTTSMGRTEDLVLRTDATTLIDYNLRRITFPQAVKAGRAALEGPTPLTRAFPNWIRPSPFAHVTPAAGR